MTRRAGAGMADVLRLAWPAILSFVLNNGYRINDTFWVQELGGVAQAAIGASTSILILNFGIFFLAAGGALPLVARATGAGDDVERGVVIRHSLVLALGVAALLTSMGWLYTPDLLAGMRLEPDVAASAAIYLRTIYLCMLPLILAPLMDNVFIAMGNTVAPMCLQGLSVALNFALNPILILGAGSWEGLGIAGAALATCLSRAVTATIALVILRRKYGVRLCTWSLPNPRRLVEIARLGLPVGLSIITYALVYVLLMSLVLSQLDYSVMAGFSVGFNGMEALSFPFILGIAMAGSSLVGRNLGARDTAGALLAVRNVRRLGLGTGVLFSLLFWFGGPSYAPFFTLDPAVLKEAIGYARVLAWSQLFVAIEIVNEKVLHGSGRTRPIFWISSSCNVLRIPLAYVLAVTASWAGAGVWWAINLTTLLKAGLYHGEVQRRRWLVLPEEGTRGAPAPAPGPVPD